MIAMHESDLLFLAGFNRARYSFVLAWVVSALCVLAICLVGALVVWTSYLVSVGRTTYEKMKQEKALTPNPYDRGCLGNWFYVLCPPRYPSTSPFHLLLWVWTRRLWGKPVTHVLRGTIHHDFFFLCPFGFPILDKNPKLCDFVICEFEANSSPPSQVLKLILLFLGSVYPRSHVTATVNTVSVV